MPHRPARNPLLLAARFAVVLVAGAGISSTAFAQAGGRGLVTTFSIAPIFEPSTSLDRGGKAGVNAIIASAGVSRQLTPQWAGGIDFAYTRADWRFDAPAAFGGAAPWGVVQRFGLAAPLVYGSGAWRYGITPTVELAAEDDAKLSKSFGYGAIASATRIFGPRLAVGLGIGAFDRIEQTRIFPFPIVQWQISDRLRLANPFRAGPTGPAGLELAYTVGDGWEVAAGGAWRTYRFRLDENGRYANGVGEVSGAPLFVRVSRSITRDIRADLLAGASVATRLKVEDAQGNDISHDKQGTVPLLGLTISARF